MKHIKQESDGLGGFLAGLGLKKGMLHVIVPILHSTDGLGTFPAQLLASANYHLLSNRYVAKNRWLLLVKVEYKHI